MTRAQETMVRAVTDALRKASLRVRTDGWPTELIVDYVAERDTYAVSLRVEIPAMPTPVEASGGGGEVTGFPSGTNSGRLAAGPSSSGGDT